MRKEKNKYNSIKPILISDGVDDKRKATCQNSIKNSIAESHVYKVFIDAHSIYLLYGIPSINEQSDSNSFKTIKIPDKIYFSYDLTKTNNNFFVKSEALSMTIIT